MRGKYHKYLHRKEWIALIDNGLRAALLNKNGACDYKKAKDLMFAFRDILSDDYGTGQDYPR